jgi:4-oxalomesaconate hydratase
MVFRDGLSHLDCWGRMPWKTALVISAHAADFVWRCGGAIALHQKRGYDVTVVCLSYGERGESAQALERKA